MLAGSEPCAWKVNFCKFTNETRNGMEDSSENSGQSFIAVASGSTAGGGYELALAADHIMLIDDGSSTVSLPEVPLLAVLPGTGGLTRVVTDKRKVRRDLRRRVLHHQRRRARPEGQGLAPGGRHRQAELVSSRRRVQERALELARASDRPADARAWR
jgi:benzoyl-CoA-dihydrodiol lyase